MTGHTDNWKYEWNKLGKPGERYYMARFSNSSQRLNYLYTLEQLNECLELNETSTVPHSVLSQALFMLLKNQVAA